MNAGHNDPPESNHFQNKSARKGKGRQKINIEKIENENNLQVTFSKRRVGLFKKASELATLTGAELLVIFFSLSGKGHAFAHPDIETISNKYHGQNQNQNQNQNQPSTETDLYLITQRNNNKTQITQELVQMENQLELEKKKAKELEMDNLETRNQGYWSRPCVLELRKNDVADLAEKFGKFKVVMDDILENHHPSIVNLNTNTNPDPNIYLNIYAPDQMNHAAGTGTDGINFPWPNQIGTNYLLDNMTDNLNGLNLMDILGPIGTNNLLDIPRLSGTNNLIDIPPGPSGTNLMDPRSDPKWEQFSTFTTTPASRSSSSNITIPGNPNTGNAAPYVLQPGNYIVPLMQHNLENMFQGTFNNNNGISTIPNLHGNVQNMFQGAFNYNNNGNGNFTVPYLGHVQNMFQGLNNNNCSRNSTAPGQNNDIQNRIQEFNRMNGHEN
ncbi:hypothetical protein RD792_007911 [Penstemon davidsonii]|uniref:MADS-box domain-containing protein n=1 Tax=Penstemon davidsonii TaxID=160366 RepID=A0ABR0D8E2_9LAMI|nr:hypothetical protein RD792_007911 [Penstemon davidsonii]